MLWKGATSVYAVAEIKRPFLDSIEISASEEPDALERRHFSLCRCGN